jgi:hypothetical protein
MRCTQEDEQALSAANYNQARFYHSLCEISEGERKRERERQRDREREKEREREREREGEEI